MKQILELIKLETARQSETISLIPSENLSYPEVYEVLGSFLSNKYSEGYPGRRYYNGNGYIDEIENEAISATCEAFGVPYANVQPYSGSPANLAVLSAVLEPGDLISGLSLSAGGHLTHGHSVSLTGKLYNSVQFGVDANGYINVDEFESVVTKNKPKLVILGTTSYPRNIDFRKLSEIAHNAGSMVLADISHIAGIVCSGYCDNPAQWVDVITSTTHKMLRGPRGAVIMVTQRGIEHFPDLPKKIDRAVFPGLQGGPHNATVAAIAITMRKAKSAQYKQYVKEVLNNASELANSLTQLGFKLVTGGTDNHLMVIDLSDTNFDGKTFSNNLEEIGIIANANAVPYDKRPPLTPSGLRVGTPYVTTRGMKADDMKMIASLFSEIMKSDGKVASLKDKVFELSKKHPLHVE